jgi:hypothetical protein
VVEATPIGNLGTSATALALAVAIMATISGFGGAFGLCRQERVPVRVDFDLRAAGEHRPRRRRCADQLVQRLVHRLGA